MAGTSVPVIAQFAQNYNAGNTNKMKPINVYEISYSITESNLVVQVKNFRLTITDEKEICRSMVRRNHMNTTLLKLQLRYNTFVIVNCWSYIYRIIFHFRIN